METEISISCNNNTHIMKASKLLLVLGAKLGEVDKKKVGLKLEISGDSFRAVFMCSELS